MGEFFILFSCMTLSNSWLFLGICTLCLCCLLGLACVWSLPLELPGNQMFQIPSLAVPDSLIQSEMTVSSDCLLLKADSMCWVRNSRS